MTTRPCFVVTVLLAALVSSVGAVETQAPTPLPAEKPIADADRDHWAYRPLAKVPIPNVVDLAWNAHPVDRLLRAEMERREVVPLPRASRATLLRRVTLDLTGLPPTPQQIDEFLADSAANAYESVIDRLLASPAYGERWAQHWLDVARFAETDGFEFDAQRPNAWRYRDWVIEALNRDMPFDEFLRLQLAGDELSDAPEGAIATGFLLCGPDMPDLNLQEERRHVVLNEMTATVGSVFLGLPVGCAQCHDHKYDAISQHDFYRLRAFFEPSELFREQPIPTAEQAAARQSAETAWSKEDHKAEKRRRDLLGIARKRFREKNPDEQPSDDEVLAELTDEERGEHAALVARLKPLPALPEMPLGRVMRAAGEHASHFYVRGDFRQPGPVLAPDFPRVVALASESAAQKPTASRAALAAWLTRPDHPLTSRVMVNRVWQWHFGKGLSPTPSDFGVMGTAPSHPQLLDWLAQRLVQEGWSMKRLHRLLVTSVAYQTACGPFDPGWTAEETATAERAWALSSAKDADNTLQWHRRRTRLDGETLRDCLLAASGRMSTRRGGPGVRPPLAPEVTVTLLKDQWRTSDDEEDHRRRSIYLFVRRNLRYPLFDVFDRPDTNASCATRHESTTAPQSLVLLNSQFSLDSARYMAGLVLRANPADRSRQIGEAYLRVLGRRPTADETRLAEAFLDRQERALQTEGRDAEALSLPLGVPCGTNRFQEAALVDLCLALFNGNEFVYVD